MTAEKDEITKEIAEELFNNAEDFLLKLKVVIQNLNNDYIDGFILKIFRFRTEI